MVFSKLVQRVNDMMAVPVKMFHNFLRSTFLVIQQNVKMVTNGKNKGAVCPTTPCGGHRCYVLGTSIHRLGPA